VGAKVTSGKDPQNTLMNLGNAASNAISSGLFAHRAYLERIGRIMIAEDPKDHILICPDADPAAFAGLNLFGNTLDPRHLRLRTDNKPAQIASARCPVLARP